MPSQHAELYDMLLESARITDKIKAFVKEHKIKTVQVIQLMKTNNFENILLIIDWTEMYEKVRKGK